MSLLDELVASSRRRLQEARASRSPAAVASQADGAPPVRPLEPALRGEDGLQVMAEFKPASPSRGPLRAKDDVEAVVASYTRAGAAAVSVLTEPDWFGSDLRILERARRACDLPLLRKDFVLDPYQVDEARAAGADAVLLIVRILDRSQLRDLLAWTAGRSMAAVVEVHHPRELDLALEAEARIIGVNSRDLDTLAVHPERAVELLRRIPREFCTAVAESGVRRGEDLRRLQAAGAHAALVGTALMEADDPGAALEALIREARQGTP